MFLLTLSTQRQKYLQILWRHSSQLPNWAGKAVDYFLALALVLSTCRGEVRRGFLGLPVVHTVASSVVKGWRAISVLVLQVIMKRRVCKWYNWICDSLSCAVRMFRQCFTGQIFVGAGRGSVFIIGTILNWAGTSSLYQTKYAKCYVWLGYIMINHFFLLKTAIQMFIIESFKCYRLNSVSGQMVNVYIKSDSLFKDKIYTFLHYLTSWIQKWYSHVVEISH